MTGSLEPGGVTGGAHRVIAAAVLVVLAVPGCAATAESGADHPVDDASTPAAASSPPSTTTAPAVIARGAVIAAQDTAASSTALGVAVLDRTTGEIAGGARGDRDPFYTASVAKVIVAVDILDRRRSTGLAVSEESLELIRRALGPSDDDAMNVLWTTFDGPGAATRVSARLGLDATSAPEDPTRWGQMSTSASDMVHVYTTTSWRRSPPGIGTSSWRSWPPLERSHRTVSTRTSAFSLPR